MKMQLLHVDGSVEHGELRANPEEITYSGNLSYQILAAHVAGIPRFIACKNKGERVVLVINADADKADPPPPPNSRACAIFWSRSGAPLDVIRTKRFVRGPAVLLHVDPRLI